MGYTPDRLSSRAFLLALKDQQKTIQNNCIPAKSSGIEFGEELVERKRWNVESGSKTIDLVDFDVILIFQNCGLPRLPATALAGCDQ